MAVNEPSTLRERQMVALRQKVENPLDPFSEPRKRPKPVTNFSVDRFEQLIPPPIGVDLKNKDGLLPFQVALLHFNWIGWKSLMDLKSLLPSQEIASQLNCDLVVNQVLNAKAYSEDILQFIGLMNDFGFDCPVDKVWSIASAASGRCLIDVISRLMVINGVKPSLADLKQALKKYQGSSRDVRRSNLHRNLFVRMLVVMPEDDIKTLNVVMPDLFLTSFEMIADYVTSGVELLIGLGYTMILDDYYVFIEKRHAIQPRGHDREVLLSLCLFNVPQDIVDQINGQSPNLFDMAMKDCGSLSVLFSYLYDAGFKITADNVKNAFDATDVNEYFFVISRLIEFLDHSGVKLCNPYDALIEPVQKIFANYDSNNWFGMMNSLFESRGYDIYQPGEMFNEIIEFLVDTGYQPTINDLRITLRSRLIGIWPFELLFNALEPSLKDCLSIEIPDLLNRVLWCYSNSRVDEDDDGFDEFQLVDLKYEEEHADLLFMLVYILLNEYNIDVNYSTEDYGFLLHTIIDVCYIDEQHKPYMVNLLDKILERKELNINQTLDRIVNGLVVKERAVDIAMALGQFEVVNKLICAGADCEWLHSRDARGKPGSLNTFKLLYKLGHFVEIYQDDELSDWISSQPIPSLLELSAMAIRGFATPTGLDDLICELKDDCGLPETVLEYLELKHLVYLIE